MEKITVGPTATRHRAPGGKPFKFKDCLANQLIDIFFPQDGQEPSDHNVYFDASKVVCGCYFLRS